MALSPQTIETVQSTIPFLMENGTALTQLFYKRLFKHNPEVRRFFNLAHQHDTTQQRALAGAICSFAQNIDTPEQLADVVKLIANKHASLQVKAEHYPIVGGHLLASIDELLNPAPKAILDAWGEAYQFLANVLIEAEKDIYEAQSNAEHGWQGFQAVTLIKKQQESESITSFVLQHPTGKLPTFLPGQFVTVRIPGQDDETTMRNYSLSGDPQSPTYRLSIKREAQAEHQGYASNWLHDHLQEGDVLEIAPPCGTFVLDAFAQQRDVVLLAAGVGLTPLLSMLHASKSKPFKVDFIHANTSPQAHAHRDEVVALCDKHTNLSCHFIYEHAKHMDNNAHLGRLDRVWLERFVDETKDVYICGPKMMMATMLNVLQDIDHPTSQIHYEFFGPQEQLHTT